MASAPSALDAALRRADELVDRRFEGWHVPGIAYGIVLGDQLIHTRGVGTLRVGEDAPPTASSVFRIASMTKSFTAATVLSLRDEGKLRLDDPVTDYVPEVRGIRLPTSDSPQITIRHLLTMTAGFPTDDPWGDRQQGLDIDAFKALLGGGLSFAFAPGMRFEYSNTGYGILGRVITAADGREYRDAVRARILDPLGMASTGYLESEVPAERMAKGYLWRDGRYLDEPSDAYGALASMGGIFTTVEDLSKWVIGFLDAMPPRDGPNGPHPLSRASRREMQQPMVPSGFRMVQASSDAMPEVEASSYGFGLFLVDDLRFGRFIGHGGGYPGFGSGMRWHHPSRLGVVTLTNHRYGPGVPLGRDILLELLRADAAPIRRVVADAPTVVARDAVEGLLESWDDAKAESLLAMNIELDEPVAERRATFARIRERHGALRRDASEPVESATPSHLAWWMTGERGGRVRVEILLSPELPPKVQTLAVTSVPVPPAPLQRAAERIVAALEPPPTGPVTIDWPADLTVTPNVDLGSVVRAMRATEARFGPVSLGPAIAGDGESKATFRLESSSGRAELALQLDVDVNCISAVSMVPEKLVPIDGI